VTYKNEIRIYVNPFCRVGFKVSGLSRIVSVVSPNQLRGLFILFIFLIFFPLSFIFHLPFLIFIGTVLVFILVL